MGHGLGSSLSYGPGDGSGISGAYVRIVVEGEVWISCSGVPGSSHAAGVFQEFMLQF
jgi:hypothetical protein